jgi:hypothetical protein
MAVHYRRQAAEARAKGCAHPHPEVAATFLSVAEDYEDLAARAEDMAAGRRGGRDDGPTEA